MGPVRTVLHVAGTAVGRQLKLRYKREVSFFQSLSKKKLMIRQRISIRDSFKLQLDVTYSTFTFKAFIENEDSL